MGKIGMEQVRSSGATRAKSMLNLRYAARCAQANAKSLRQLFNGSRMVTDRRLQKSFATMSEDRMSPEMSDEIVDPAPVQEEKLSPAELDKLNFEEGESVEFWKNWTRRSPVDDLSEIMEDPGSFSFDKLKSLYPASLAEWGVNDYRGLQYWSYHTLRTGFFTAQAAAGLIASRRNAESAGSFDYLTTNTGAKLITEALQMYRQDYKNIREGLYKEPYDMDLGHRQYDPFFVLGRSRKFLKEASATLSRRSKGQAEDVWLKSGLYPDYYLNTWHYQTDGWLSRESAGVYETSTETLFLGQQDAMQRQTLVPLSKYLQGKDVSDMKVMELACGTGRFATYIKDNFPEMHVTCVDLSPFYLEEARGNMDHWFKLRGNGAPSAKADFLQAPAEKLPVPDASYDAITCIYLFHELTREVQDEIVKEMYRVLKPGGLLVFTDSIQLGDRPELDGGIDNFTDFNEPNYSDYVRTDLAKVFTDGGFTCGTKELASRSKVLSFMK